jgi:hypothetical protein
MKSRWRRLTLVGNTLSRPRHFLAGARESLPDPDLLLTVRFPWTSFGRVRSGRDELGPYIAAVLRDRPASGEGSNERFFDPWYFTAMCLMELPGGHFKLSWSKVKYLYVNYVGQKVSQGEHSLRRIIANPSPYEDVRDIKGLGAGHYDQRRVTLRLISKGKIRKEGQQTHAPSLTRDDAINVAVNSFEDRLSHSNIAILGLSCADYESSLRNTLDVADKMHAERLKHPVPSSKLAAPGR